MGPRALLPQPKPPSGGPRVQESFVKRIIAVRVFVRLMSPRIFSSRHLVGTTKFLVKLFVAHGLAFVGSGSAFNTTCAAGLNRALRITCGVGTVASPLAGSGNPSAGKPNVDELGPAAMSGKCRT